MNLFITEVLFFHLKSEIFSITICPVFTSPPWRLGGDMETNIQIRLLVPKWKLADSHSITLFYYLPIHKIYKLFICKSVCVWFSAIALPAFRPSHPTAIQGLAKHQVVNDR